MLGHLVQIAMQIRLGLVGTRDRRHKSLSLAAAVELLGRYCANGCPCRVTRQENDAVPQNGNAWVAALNALFATRNLLLDCILDDLRLGLVVFVDHFFSVGPLVFASSHPFKELESGIVYFGKDGERKEESVGGDSGLAFIMRVLDG